MNKIFHSRFWSAMEFLGTAFVLNCMWLIGCLPVVSAGASTAALCQCYFRIFRNREEALPRLFLNGFKNCFKQASLVWLVHLFFLADVGLIWWTKKQGIELPWLLSNHFSVALAGVAALLVLFTGAYIYGVIAYYKLSLSQCVINCLGLAFRYLGQTIMMILMTACTAVLIRLAPFLALIAGSLCCAAQCRVMLKLFDAAELAAGGEAGGEGALSKDEAEDVN